MRRSVAVRSAAVRGLGAGFAGTTAMTIGYALERRLRRNVGGFLDYDDSNVPALAAAHVLHWSDPDPTAERVLGLLVHWGYGSAVGVAAVPLVRRQGAVPATASYWAGIMIMAAALFPVLGGTPPPWRWRWDTLATSAAQHLVYAAVVVAVLRAVDADSAVDAHDPTGGAGTAGGAGEATGAEESDPT